MKKFLMFLSAGLVAAMMFLTVSSTVLAAPIYFTDRSLFHAAIVGTLNFEGFNTDFEVAASQAFSGFTFSETGSLPGVGNAMNYPWAHLSITEGAGAIVYDDNGDSIANFQFTSDINAFGVDMTVLLENNMVTVGGDLNSTFSLLSDIPGFFGVIDYEGLFDSITFSASGGPNVGFDALEFGVTSNPVPEPATMLLLGSGLIGLAGLGRKFKKK